MKKRRRGFGTLYLGRPSGKQISHEFKLTSDTIDHALESHRAIVKPVGYNLHPKLQDTKRMLEIIEEQIPDPELLEALVETERGQGYLVGFLMAMLAHEEMENEDTDFLF